MKTMGIDIPQEAIDAGKAAMTGIFRMEDVRGAIAAVLRTHATDPAKPFDYGIQPKDAVDDRTADRMMQAARKAGRITFLGARGWKAEG